MSERMPHKTSDRMPALMQEFKKDCLHVKQIKVIKCHKILWT
jgi:hypothetical protein